MERYSVLLLSLVLVALSSAQKTDEGAPVEPHTGEQPMTDYYGPNSNTNIRAPYSFYERATNPYAVRILIKPFFYIE